MRSKPRPACAQSKGLDHCVHRKKLAEVTVLPLLGSEMTRTTGVGGSVMRWGTQGSREEGTLEVHVGKCGRGGKEEPRSNLGACAEKEGASPRSGGLGWGVVTGAPSIPFSQSFL